MCVYVSSAMGRELTTFSSYMLRKLYSLVSGDCAIDNPDSPQHQEILLPGQLYGMIVKERLEEALNAIRALVMMDVRNGAPTVDFQDGRYLNKVLQKVNFDVGARLSNFMATLNMHRMLHFRVVLRFVKTHLGHANSGFWRKVLRTRVKQRAVDGSTWRNFLEDLGKLELKRFAGEGNRGGTERAWERLHTVHFHFLPASTCCVWGRLSASS